MAMNNLGLGFIFTAKDQASGVVRGLNTNMKSLGGTAGMTGAKMTGALIGIGAAAGTAAVGAKGFATSIDLANEAGDFGKQLATVGAITQASTADLGMLENAAIQAGLATKFTPTEAIEGLRELSVRGFNAAEASQALNGALNLAAAGQISIADASTASAAAMRVFGLDASQAGATTDKLLAITNRTALQASDLALALGNVSRGAIAAGQDLDEMLIAVGLVKNTGVEASVASNAVSSALQFMAKNADKFEGLGVNVTDASGNFRDFGDIVLDTSKIINRDFPNAAKRADKIRELFGRFGVTAYTAMSKQLGSGIRDANGQIVKMDAALTSLRQNQDEAAGRGESFIKAQLATYQGQQELLKGAVGTVRLLFGQVFAGIFRPIVNVIYLLTTELAGAFQRLPGPIKTVLGVMFLLGSVFLFVVGAVTGLVLLGVILAPFLLVLAKAALIAAVAFGGLVVAFGLVALAAYAFYQSIQRNIGGIGDWFRARYNQVKLVFTALKELFSEGRLSIATAMQLEGEENKGLVPFIARVYNLGQQLLAFWNGIVKGWETGLERLAPTWQMLSKAVDDFLSAIGAAGGALQDAAGDTNTMYGRGQSLASVLVNLVGVLAEVVSWALMIGAAFIKAGVWISDVFGDAVLGVTITLKALWVTLQNIGQALLWLTTLGGAGGDWVSYGFVTEMVEEEDARRARTRRRLTALPGAGATVGPAVPTTQAYPAGAYATVEGTGIATITPQEISASVATGVSQGLRATPVKLEGQFEGETLVSAINNLGTRLGNRGGIPPVPSGVVPQGGTP